MMNVLPRPATDGGLAAAAILAVRAYQRWVSPYKGFGCAHRVHTGEASCSHFVLHALRTEGFFAARHRARERFAACREASLAMHADPAWVAASGHGALQAASFCIPTPVGCCWVSG